MQHELFGIIMGMIVAAVVIGGSIYLLFRTPGKDKRVAGPPIPGDELTQQERDAALENLTTLNQWETLRNNGSLPH
jgi:hypothetical protein